MEISKDFAYIAVTGLNFVVMICTLAYNRGRDVEWKIAAENKRISDKDELLKEIHGNKSYFVEKFDRHEKDNQKTFDRMHIRLDENSCITENECSTRHSALQGRVAQSHDSFCALLSDTKKELLASLKVLQKSLENINEKYNKLDKDIIELRVKKNDE